MTTELLDEYADSLSRVSLALALKYHVPSVKDAWWVKPLVGDVAELTPVRKLESVDHWKV